MPHPYSDADTTTTSDFALTADTARLLEALSKYPSKNADWRVKLKKNLETIYEYNGFLSFPGNQLAILTDEGDLIIAAVRPQCKQHVLDKLIELSASFPAWDHKIKEEEIATIRAVIATETAEVRRQAGLASLPASLPPTVDGPSSSLDALLAVAPTPPCDALSPAPTDAAYSQIASRADPIGDDDSDVAEMGDTVPPLRAAASGGAATSSLRRAASAPASFFYRPTGAAPAPLFIPGLGAGKLG